MSSISMSLPPAPPSSSELEAWSSPNSKLHSPSSLGYVSVSLILADSGSSPYDLRARASSALYLRMTSPLSSW